MKYPKEEIEKSKKRLKELLPKVKYTIYTNVRYVSRNGMYRHINCFVIIDNEPLNINWEVARVLGLPLKNDGVAISGCGMDIGFHIVYNLGEVLYQNGYALTQKWL